MAMDAPTDTALTPVEHDELERLEGIISRGAFEVGEALRRIQQGRLYRTYGTFDDYLGERWSFTHQQAWRLMQAADAMRNLSTASMGAVSPANEAQVRPLVVGWCFDVTTLHGGHAMIPCPYCEAPTELFLARDGAASWRCLRRECRKISRFMADGAPLVAVPRVRVVA